MSSNDKAEKRRSSRACLECRLAKTKCQVTDNQDVCDRCAKFSFDCKFVRHHRGRKPVSKLASIDADDLDAAAGPSRLAGSLPAGGFDGSDDELATDRDSDSAHEDAAVKFDSSTAHEDDTHASDPSEAPRASNRDNDTTGSGAFEGLQRRSREIATTRPSGSRSHSKARMHRLANSLNELDNNARRRIWEMLAQKIPQRGSTYTFVSKGEVAHDNLQASTSKSTSNSSSNNSNTNSNGKRASSPPSVTDVDGNGADNGSRGQMKAADDLPGPAMDTSAGSAQAAKSSAPSQHFASTFRNLLRPVDKRAGAMTAKEEAESAVTARYPRLPETLNLSGPTDPIDLGILSMAAARRLYAYYFKHLNPWGMNFDPYFVSHDAVRASSSFLYSTILYLASRYIELADADEVHSEAAAFYGAPFARPRPDDDRVTAAISAQLGSHVRSLAVTAFALGDRRMETGVAMYLSSVWKEADDHFTILYCSYAAKIMSDIPTELLSLLPSCTSASFGVATTSRSKNGTKAADDANAAATLHQQRLRRNQQRQFLFHFIQEHTHLLHFAPRPNFDRGPSLLRNLLAWADDALATEDDVLLCADIDSVLLQTKYKSIMERAQAQEKDTLYGGSECFLLLQSFMDELEGWTSRWELQARKIDQRFAHDAEPSEPVGQNGDPASAEDNAGGSQTAENFAGHLPLDARMHLLSVMRSSLVMQISSIAFRASLRDINKAKPNAASSKSSNLGSSTFSPSALSAMDDRAEQIYYTCLDSALNLLVHTMQMPPSILRHAQDMIMVLAPHAALLATYLISLPLPSLPPHFPAAAASERLGYEYAKVKTRIRRRKEYERKCLELMRDTRESFRLAQVRADDHVGLCAQYFDSLLNVIEGGDAGDASGGQAGSARVGRSLLSNTSVLAGTKRSRSMLDGNQGGQVDEESAARGLTQNESTDSAMAARSNSAGPAPLLRAPHQQQHHSQIPRHGGQHRHHANTTNMDASAAETLLNLHSESQPLASGAAPEDADDAQTAPERSTSPTAATGARVFTGSGGGGAYYASASSGSGSHHLAHPRIGGSQHTASTPPSSTSIAAPFSPGTFITTGMFGHFAPPPSGSIPNSPQHPSFHAGHHAHYQPHHNQQQPHSHHAQGYPSHPVAGEVGFAPLPHPVGGTGTPTGAAGGTGTSTPVDWTWLQSFLEVPEFSWM